VLERVENLVLRQTDLSAPLRSKVSNLRQLGTIVAMELEDRAGSYMSALGPRLMAFFRERDVLLRPLGNTVYVMPPYSIADDDLARVYAVIGEAVDAL
jgi:adenosylmethionine-8-amino-7-oxononanoate aminotransferase